MKITNPNYIPPNLEKFYPDAFQKADHRKEAYCPKCKGYTTNYNSRGECKECGTEVLR